MGEAGASIKSLQRPSLKWSRTQVGQMIERQQRYLNEEGKQRRPGALVQWDARGTTAAQTM